MNFKSNVDMYENEFRSQKYRKNFELESALKELNELIEPLSTAHNREPVLPIILIMGAPRSGSTLLYQFLASSNAFSFPSNLVARFYRNPYFGIRLQQILFDFDSNNELALKGSAEGYESKLGKTQGALAPSEFWYYWREYFKFDSINMLNEEELSKVKSKQFLSKLSAFEILYNKPLLMKGMLLNWNIPFLYSIYPKFIFINLRRKIIPNAHSLLYARVEYFNDKSKWYSFMPPEYPTLKKLSPIEQVVGQVHYTELAVEKGLSSVPDSNKINISYEEFCENPSLLIDSLNDKLRRVDEKMKLKLDTPTTFLVSKSSENMNVRDQLEYQAAVNKFKGSS